MNIEKIQDNLEDLKEILEFYADPENHKLQHYPCRCGNNCQDIHPMQEDMGEKARDILKRIL